MVEIYTHNFFYKFQYELWHSLSHLIEFVSEDEENMTYHFVSEKKDGCNVHKVFHDKNTNFVSCIFKKFNNESIPYKHILALLKELQVTLLPAAYILKRWTKVANLEKVMDDDGEEINDYKDKSLFLQRTKLFHFTSEVIDRVVSSEEVSQLFTNSLEDLLKKLSQ